MYTIYFSQSQKNLFESLKKTLFGKPTFLASQIVIMGSREMKKELICSSVKDPEVSVFSAIKVLYKEDVNNFLEGFFPNKSLPSRMEVSLMLEKELSELIEKGTSHPLIKLIRVDRKKRLSLFAENLSEIFMKYFLFSPEFFEKKDDFIATLFARVSRALCIDFLSEKNLDLEKVPGNLNIHLFCCRYIPPIYTKIFKMLGTKCTVTNYILSPTMHYWEDFLSDNEEKKFLKKIPKNKEVYREVFEDKHPLLANFGVMKREHVKNCNDDFASVFEEYPETQPGSFLEQVRKDLLELNVEQKNLSFDDSLKVVKTSSLLEEVLAVKKLIDQYQSTFSYDQMAIYVPDIDLYAPFLEMGLGIDLKGKSYKLINDQCQAALDLLSILKNGFEMEKFHSILFNPLIQKKFSLSIEDVYRMTRWTTELKLDETFTLDRLIYGLIYFVDKELYEDVYPLFGIEMGDTDLVNKLIVITQRLKEDILFFQEKKRAIDFLDRMREIEEFYFFSEDNLLSKITEKFTFDWYLEENISSISLLLRIIDLLNNKKSSLFSHSLDMPTICCSKNSLPSSFPIIFVLGVSESFYSYQKDALDPMQYTSFLPMQKDQDHAFFLEVLLLAKNKLIFSYFETHDQKNPAFVLQELFSYLDAHYTIDLQKPTDSLIQSVQQIVFTEKQRTINETILLENALQEEKTLRVENLFSFAKHPIKYYFQRSMGVDAEKFPIGKIDKEADFSMSPRDQALFKFFLPEKGFERTEREFKKSEMLPDPFIYKAISLDLKAHEKQLKELFEKFSLRREDFIQISLWENPLKVVLEERCLDLVGVFKAHKEGFILPEDKIENVLRIWPVILLFVILEKKEVFLFSIKEKTKRKLVVENPEKELALYLNYFFLAKNKPSPMISYFVQSFLFKDVDHFKKKLEQRIGLGYKDPYLEYVFSQNSPEQIFYDWEEGVKKVFSGLIEAYERACEIV